MTIPFTLTGSPAELHQRVLELPRYWFATLDGAMHEGLAGRLNAAGLFNRALYLEGADASAVANGPYLVTLPDAAAVARLMEITGAGPSAVFWSWAQSEADLYRHLRRKNMCEIPPENPAQRPYWDKVFFRHADPNVLATLLTVLTPSQQSSFIGRAKAIAFWAPDAIGTLVANRPMDLPKPDRETIRFTEEQYAQIEQNRVVRNRRRVMNYLHRTAARVVGNWKDDALYRVVVEAEDTGRRAGLRTEYSHWLWAYLYVVTERGIAQDGRFAESLQQPAHTPDEVLEVLFDGLIQQMRGVA